MAAATMVQLQHRYARNSRQLRRTERRLYRIGDRIASRSAHQYGVTAGLPAPYAPPMPVVPNFVPGSYGLSGLGFSPDDTGRAHVVLRYSKHGGIMTSRDQFEESGTGRMQWWPEPYERLARGREGAMGGLGDAAAAMTGAATGAAIGTAVPIIGTAVGAVIGGAAGYFSKSGDSYDPEKVAQQQLRAQRVAKKTAKLQAQSAAQISHDNTTRTVLLVAGGVAAVGLAGYLFMRYRRKK